MAETFLIHELALLAAYCWYPSHPVCGEYKVFIKSVIWADLRKPIFLHSGDICPTIISRKYKFLINMAPFVQVQNRINKSRMTYRMPAKLTTWHSPFFPATEKHRQPTIWVNLIARNLCCYQRPERHIFSRRALSSFIPNRFYMKIQNVGS